jgi:hypothetical protein
MAYGSYAGEYWDAGWRCILPVPAQTKTPPPEGYTGEHGIDELPAEVLAEWERTHYHDSIALRLPAEVIAIDVDHYDKLKTLPDGATATVAKRGDDTLRSRARGQPHAVLPGAAGALPGQPARCHRDPATPSPLLRGLAFPQPGRGRDTIPLVRAFRTDYCGHSSAGCPAGVARGVGGWAG